MIDYNSLTETTMQKGIDYLTAIDDDFQVIVGSIGPPPMWAREPGFPTLVHIILEQQVSLASARAAFERLKETLPEFTPDSFLKLNSVRLKQIGFSRQKIASCRELAESIRNNFLRIDNLVHMPDESALIELKKIKGIGDWTAHIYLLMALRRPDIWPSGDLALSTALQKIKKLTSRPDSEQMVEIADQWKPWRAIAARIIWHYYLSN